MSGPILCLDLWYVWSDLMSGSMVCVVYPSTMVCVVCLVLSYAGQSYDGMVCVVYPASPSTMDLWYVWLYPMLARTMTVWYAWRCPTSPRPAILWYVWSHPMSGSMVCVVYGSVVCPVLSYVVPSYDPNLCVALSYVAQACDPAVCAVLSYAAPGRRRASTYFAQSHPTSAYVRVCGPHRTILRPRSAAWRPGGQRSRQGAPTLPCLIVQLGQVEGYAYLQSARASSPVGPCTRADVRVLGGGAAGRFENRNVRGGGNALFGQSGRGAAVASLGSFRPMGGRISGDTGYFCNFGQTFSSQHDSGMR
jgi:hypothetical protein